MSVTHNGFTFRCDANAFRSQGNECGNFTSQSRTERTAIVHARNAGWFVGVIRITIGAPRSRVESMRRTLCPHCAWWVGLKWVPRG